MIFRLTLHHQCSFEYDTAALFVVGDVHIKFVCPPPSTYRQAFDTGDSTGLPVYHKHTIAEISSVKMKHGSLHDMLHVFLQSLGDQRVSLRTSQEVLRNALSKYRKSSASSFSSSGARDEEAFFLLVLYNASQERFADILQLQRPWLLRELKSNAPEITTISADDQALAPIERLPIELRHHIMRSFDVSTVSKLKLTSSNLRTAALKLNAHSGRSAMLIWALKTLNWIEMSTEDIIESLLSFHDEHPRFGKTILKAFANPNGCPFDLDMSRCDETLLRFVKLVTAYTYVFGRRKHLCCCSSHVESASHLPTISP